MDKIAMESMWDLRDCQKIHGAYILWKNYAEILKRFLYQNNYFLFHLSLNVYLFKIVFIF